MKARRTNRIAGIVGLFAALALAVSGCGALDSLRGQGDPSKVFSASLAKPKLASDWVKDYGTDQALPKQISDAGVNIMSVMFDTFPQYTVAGFVPTEQNWSESSAKIKPLVSDKSFQTIQSNWTNNKLLPVLTSYQEDKDAPGQHTNDFKGPDGKTCGATDKPYSMKMDNVILNSESTVPVFTGVVALVVQCKDGGTLTGKMNMSFQMMKNDQGSWVMKDSYNLKNAQVFSITK